MFFGKRPESHQQIPVRESQQWTDFELFMRHNFPEHSYRVLHSKFLLYRIRFLYPCVLLIAALALMALMSFILQMTLYESWIGAAIVLSFVSLGIWLGDCKARQASFEREKLLLQLRQLWHLEKIQLRHSIYESWEGKQGPSCKTGPA